MGERTITLDCDVIQADGGTRTASISGAWVALNDAVQQLITNGELQENPIHCQVAAISVGVFKHTPVLDLDYAEDSTAETDMNIVMNNHGGYIEVQGTAEGDTFTDDELTQMLSLARDGIGQIFDLQLQA